MVDEIFKGNNELIGWIKEDIFFFIGFFFDNVIVEGFFNNEFEIFVNMILFVIEFIFFESLFLLEGERLLKFFCIYFGKGCNGKS